ncbi:hypothetical protein NM688_g9432 [Phlebia brevispora]|uniref:Uncharacterized protein n=1 Tax=Phlebia brevispora TaxID=194682 RepID=A0ACC1RJ83_9APHY|nr:hypothetical protein NM688_g9432 [Phlebia brevispora]
MPQLVPPVVSCPVDPQDLVRRKLGVEVKSSQVVGKDAFCTTHDVVLEDGRAVSLRLPNNLSLASVVEAEVCIAQTSIPVPKVLSYGLVDEDKELKVSYLIFEKVSLS